MPVKYNTENSNNLIELKILKLAYVNTIEKITNNTNNVYVCTTRRKHEN